MLKLSIIGCGNVAKTMGHLWHQTQALEIIDVVNRSQASADASVAFIGAGKALAAISTLRPADIFVIACGDDQIETCLDELLAQKVVQTNTIVFHFSGAKSAMALDKAKSHGALCASLHPVKSFADPKSAIKTFANTYCGIEGDDKACEVITKLINAIQGQCFTIESDKKMVYHAASVFACNYLVALQELSLKVFAHSGIERDLAMNILEPIVKETTDNMFKLGTAHSLTGPIARGDSNLVSKQLNAVNAWNEDAGEVYRLLGKLSADLSDKKGISNKTDLADIQAILANKKR